MLRILMKDGYGESIRKRNAILKNERPQSLRFKNRKNLNINSNTNNSNNRINNTNYSKFQNNQISSYQNTTSDNEKQNNNIYSERIENNSISKSKNLKSKSQNKNIEPKKSTTGKSNKTTRINTNSNTYINTNQISPLDTDNTNKDRLQLLEEYIKIIKSKGQEEPQEEIDKKIRLKEQLQNNIDILNANIKFANKENKVNSSLGKNIIKENEILISSSNRAAENSYLIKKDLPSFRNEIDNMKTKLSQLNEETKNLRNIGIEYDRSILVLQDEVRKLNNLNSNLIKEKEKVSNEIIKYQKSIEMLISKINLVESESDKFMKNVEFLAKKAMNNSNK